MDGTYSEDLLVERYSSDLANDLGNLWHRTASMIEKYFAGTIPEPSAGALQMPLAQKALRLWGEVAKTMQAYDARESLTKMWAIVVGANQLVEEKKPWALAKDPAKRQELADTLYVLAESVAHIAVLLQAFMPQTALKILERLKIPGARKIQRAQDFEKPLLSAGIAIEKGEPLFPRLEEKAK